MTLTLDRVTVYCRASLIDLYLHANRRNFVGEQTYEHWRPTLLRRLRRVDLETAYLLYCKY